MLHRRIRNTTLPLALLAASAMTFAGGTHGDDAVPLASRVRPPA